MTCDTCNLPLHTSSKKLGRCSHCRRTDKTREKREAFWESLTGRIVGDAMAKVLTQEINHA